MARLEREQIELLRDLAEEARSAPRDRRTFLLLPALSVIHLIGPSGQRAVSDPVPHDIEDLARAGLLRIRARRQHEVEFTVTPEAYDFLESQAALEPLARVEEAVLSRYIEADEFRARYPTPYQRWAEAAALLWGASAETELTTIGHKTREAVQEFATALGERHGVKGASENPAHTVNRLRAVIEAQRGRLGEARRELLDALIAYWGEVNDLLQRQEHGAQKEGEPLSWEDGRRAVFQTAVVMYEIDRTL